MAWRLPRKTLRPRSWPSARSSFSGRPSRSAMVRDAPSTTSASAASAPALRARVEQIVEDVEVFGDGHEGVPMADIGRENGRRIVLSDHRLGRSATRSTEGHAFNRAPAGRPGGVAQDRSPRAAPRPARPPCGDRSPRHGDRRRSSSAHSPCAARRATASSQRARPMPPPMASGRTKRWLRPMPAVRLEAVESEDDPALAFGQAEDMPADHGGLDGERSAAAGHEARANSPNGPWRRVAIAVSAAASPGRAADADQRQIGLPLPGRPRLGHFVVDRLDDVVAPCGSCGPIRGLVSRRPFVGGVEADLAAEPGLRAGEVEIVDRRVLDHA